MAALSVNPQEQSSKSGQVPQIIILRDGVVVDFAMNTICAAGTGRFDRKLPARCTYFELGDGSVCQTGYPYRLCCFR